MKIGIIGLGRMGASIALRLIKAGHEVIGFDTNAEHARLARASGVDIVDCIPLLAQQVRCVWLMVPAGHTIDLVVQELVPHLRPHDVVIDGGNSHYKDSMRRALLLAKDEIFFLDCGTSGGLQGREHGYCLMIGGDKKPFLMIEPVFRAIAAPDGYAHVGPSGAGHYVKMVHNGIEYALLQGYAEGLHVLHDGSFERLDLAQITALWNHGSIIRSWLLTLAHEIVQEDANFTAISGRLDQTGTGRWMVQEAHEKKIPVPCIEKAVHVRSMTQQTKGNYATRFIALLRNAFGGHRVYKKTEDL